MDPRDEPISPRELRERLEAIEAKQVVQSNDDGSGFGCFLTMIVIAGSLLVMRGCAT